MIRYKILAAAASAAVVLGSGTAAYAGSVPARTAGSVPAAASHKGSITDYFQNYPGLPEGDGSLWDDNGVLKTSRTHATKITVSSLTFSMKWSTITQLVDASAGVCFGPVRGKHVWRLRALSARQCAHHVPRSQFIEFGNYDSTTNQFTEVGFENVYQLDNVCMSDAIQANGPGKDVTSPCDSGGLSWITDSEGFVPVSS
jgi:hypothetical protein